MAEPRAFPEFGEPSAERLHAGEEHLRLALAVGVSADSRAIENPSPTIDIAHDGNSSGLRVLDMRARDDSYSFLEGAVVTKRFKNSRETNGLEVERTKED
jgi:hypothetical protein